MILSLPKETRAKAALCNHGHACLKGNKIHPQCKVVAGSPNGCVIVEPKPHFKGNCSYYRQIINDSNHIIKTCFCHVRCEVFKKTGYE